MRALQYERYLQSELQQTRELTLPARRPLPVSTTPRVMPSTDTAGRPGGQGQDTQHRQDNTTGEEDEDQESQTS